MKMFLLVALVLALAVSAVIVKTSTSFRRDKAIFVKEFSDRFTGTVAKLTADRITTIQNNTATFVSNRESLKSINSAENVEKLLFERFSDAMVVALVDKSTGEWNINWIEKNNQSAAKIWPEKFENTLVKSLNFDATVSSGLYLSRLTQPNNSAAIAVAFPATLQAADGSITSEKKSVIVAIVNPTAFEDAVAEFRSDVNEVFIIDQRGYVYAHSDVQYTNKNFENHPLVKEIREQNKEGATGEFYDLEGNSIIGSYRKIRGTNLYSVSTTQAREAFKAADQLVQSVMVFGIGFGLIGIVIAIFVAGRITNPLHKLQAIAAKIGGGDFKINVDVKTSDEVGELAKSIDQMKTSLLEREEALESSRSALIQSEKMSAFGQLSAGIAHEVKNPLAGILGHAQLAKGKAGDPDLKKHIEVIEKETRRTKEIIENLMRFARAEKAELKPTNLYETVTQTVDLVDHQLTLMGVKIFKHLSPVAMISGNSNQIQQVLLNLMMNAGHAMEKSNVKELHVYLEQVDQLARIRIQDTGSGMPPDVQKRIFEPFFTTKPAGKGTGLGLSVSMGIVRDHNGKIYVQSEIGQGTTFFIDFPVTKDSPIQASAPIQTKPVTPAVETPSAIVPPPAPAPEPVVEQAYSHPPKDTATAIPTPPPAPFGGLKKPVSSEAKTLGGKAPLGSDFDGPPKAATAKAEPPEFPPSISETPVSAKAESPQPPPPPLESEVGYNQPKPEGEEFKVSIRRPKLKV